MAFERARNFPVVFRKGKEIKIPVKEILIYWGKYFYFHIVLLSILCSKTDHFMFKLLQEIKYFGVNVEKHVVDPNKQTSKFHTMLL